MRKQTFRLASALLLANLGLGAVGCLGVHRRAEHRGDNHGRHEDRREDHREDRHEEHHEGHEGRR